MTSSMRLRCGSAIRKGRVITRLVTGFVEEHSEVKRRVITRPFRISLLPRPDIGGSPQRGGSGRNDDHGRENVCANSLTSANSFSRVVKSLDSHPFRLHRLTTVFAAEITSEMRTCGSMPFSNNCFSSSSSYLIIFIFYFLCIS